VSERLPTRRDDASRRSESRDASKVGRPSRATRRNTPRGRRCRNAAAAAAAALVRTASGSSCASARAKESDAVYVHARYVVVVVGGRLHSLRPIRPPVAVRFGIREFARARAQEGLLACAAGANAVRQLVRACVCVCLQLETPSGGSERRSWECLGSIKVASDESAVCG
jgi:hypothetical protein